MKELNLLLVVILALSFQGCVYNSINLVDLLGKDMKYKRGITGMTVEGVERIVILRQTNCGKGASPDAISYPNLKCIPEKPIEDN